MTGTVVQVSLVRYTPAGVAVSTVEIEHTSQVIQAGSSRALMFTLEITAVGDAALTASQLLLGQTYVFEGFWAPAHYRTKRISFHLQRVV